MTLFHAESAAIWRLPGTCSRVRQFLIHSTFVGLLC